MFNADDYNDNIDYCHYVFEKNEELNLGLNTPREIQNVANNYLDEIYARRGIVDDEVYENEKILLDVVAKFQKKFNKFKAKVEEKRINNEIDSGFEINPEIDVKDEIEKKVNRNGELDHFGLDEEFRTK